MRRLAAARELPNATVAIPTGEDYVHRNMPDAVATVSTPYAEPIPGPSDAGIGGTPTSGTPDPMKIEVTVHQHAGVLRPHVRRVRRKRHGAGRRGAAARRRHACDLLLR